MLLVREAEGKRPLGRPSSRWEYIIIKYSFRKRDVASDWMELAQYREGWRALGNAVMNLQIP